MRQVFFKITYITMAAAVLSGCSLQKATRNAGEAVIPQATAPSMAPMKYTWNTNYSAMLSPPREIREKALEACAQRGLTGQICKPFRLMKIRRRRIFPAVGQINKLLFMRLWR